MDIDAIAIRDLDRETVRRLSQRSDARGFLQLGIHAGVLFATGFLVWASRGHLWLAPAIVLHGLVLNFLFCALHESIHRTAFASRWANDLVASVCGALLLLPREFFRFFHFAHHRFTQDLARDPELAQPSPATLASYLWRASGMPNWHKRFTVTLRHALTGHVAEPFVPPDKYPLIVREARILWACYLGVALVSLYFQRAGCTPLSGSPPYRRRSSSPTRAAAKRRTPICLRGCPERSTRKRTCACAPSTSGGSADSNRDFSSIRPGESRQSSRWKLS